MPLRQWLGLPWSLSLAETGSDMLKGLSGSGSGAIAGQLPGLATGGNIGAGFVGEVIKTSIASGSAVGLTTATPSTVMSLSLTAGVWTIFWAIDYTFSTTTATLLQGGPSPTTNTLPSQVPGSFFYTGDTLGTNPSTWTATSVSPQLVGMPQLIVLGSTSTVYLVASATFSAGTVSAYGSIAAIRNG